MYNNDIIRSYSRDAAIDLKKNVNIKCVLGGNVVIG